MPVPTPRFAMVVAGGAVVVLAAGFGSVPALLALNAVLVVVALADWILAPSPDRIGLERSLPATLTIGVEGEVVWRITNPLERPLRVAVADELAPSLLARTRRAQLRLPGRATVTARTTIRPTRRGRFAPTDVVVRVEGPLGLAARQRGRALPGMLRVYPPFRSRDEAELRIEKARILEVGLRSAKGRGSGTEFDSLREYSIDDDSRRIDWAATARSTKTIVRTYRAERNQTVILLLDNGRVMAGRVGAVPRVEHAMDNAMVLTAVATHLGDRTGLVAFDSEVRRVVTPGTSRAQLRRITEAMYDLEPQLVESDYHRAFTETLVRFRRRSLLVLLTELAEEAVTETLVPALPMILRHHLVIVASVQDPDVVRWAAASPPDAGSAYRKAAALAALERRRHTVGVLRAMGVTVVDGPAGTVAGQLADAYLSLKATARL